jgi:acyl dehydratase
MTVPAEASLLNPVELFMAADWVVKSVMVGLALASLWSWAVILDKAFRFAALNRQADAFETLRESISAFVDANERRVVLHQVVTTGTISAPDALVAHFYPIVPLAKPSKGGAKAPPKDPVVIPANAREIDTWRLGPKAGLDFALVTGDFNPIHWVGFAARMAGFKNVILHGFAELARSVEGLQRNVLMGDTRRICEIDVRFVKPLVLPRTTSLFLLRLPDGDQPGAFAVGDAPGAPAFLTGTFRLRD